MDKNKREKTFVINIDERKGDGKKKKRKIESNE